MDGKFMDGQKEIEWIITDPSDGGITYSNGNEMWKRFIHFHSKEREIGFTAIYGEVEDMQNISNDYAENQYKKLKENGDINFK